ncbi:MAG: DegV family protein [Anaerolineae bacterium]
MLKVLVDSTCDLLPEEAANYGLHIIPMYVTFGGKTYRDDGRELSREEFYRRLRTERELPRTSQPSIGDFEQVFRELTADGNALLCLTLSSKLSGTWQAAKAAAELVPTAQIHVADTRVVSVALSLLAIQAVEMASAGAPAEDIIATLQSIERQFRIVFVVETLEYLQKGGRIGTASALLGTLLDIKPLLTIKDGLVQPLHKVRSKKAAKARMLEIFEAGVAPGSAIAGAVAHTASPEEAQWLAEELRARYNCRRLYISEMGPVVGTHGGPGLIGAAMYPIEAEQPPARSSHL